MKNQNENQISRTEFAKSLGTVFVRVAPTKETARSVRFLFAQECKKR
jgi:hypothetical protein